MIRYSIFIILILSAIKLTAQPERECDQFITIIEFLKNDSTANIRFEINPQIAENKGTPFLITEYYADKMNLTENDIKSDTTILNSIHRDNQSCRDKQNFKTKKETYLWEILHFPI